MRKKARERQEAIVNTINESSTHFSKTNVIVDEEGFWTSIESYAGKKRREVKAKKRQEAHRNNPVEHWAELYIMGKVEGEFIYASVNYKVLSILLKDGTECFKKTLTGDLKTLADALSDQGIIRIHASFCVNEQHVLGVDSNYVYMDNMHKVKWSRTYKDCNMEKLSHLLIDPKIWRYDPKKFTKISSKDVD
jgi:hypothetical protein